MESFDIVVVGYGPTGRLLALKLGRRGHRVLVLERQRTTYPLPRAVHHDDEIGRILQGVGLPPSSIPDITEPYDDFYEWRNAAREPLVRLDWRGRGPSGWNVSNFFHQPALEEALDALVRDTATVTVRCGHRVVGHHDDGDGVTVRVEADGATYQVRGGYVVGADGARSTVRDWIGAGFEDLGYFRDWLVADLVLEKPLGIDPPAWQSCDPLRPTTLVPAGPGRRRWEFMRLDGEDPTEFASEAYAWQLLAPWGVTRDNASLTRHAVYTFQARWADQWRKGRLLLAGDSAHQMPPFAGQGMCTGLRDALNLEWKLDAVLRGAPDRLLDSYGSERAAHVRDFISFSMELGQVICINEPAAAADRDTRLKAELAAGLTPPPRPLPRLGAGLHTGDGNLAGTLAPQGRVTGDRASGLFDDVIGGPGALVGPAHALAGLPAGHRDALTAAGVRPVALAAHPAPGTVVDTDGTYAAWLAEADAECVLVRPDFYVYGSTSPGEDPAVLVEGFLSGIGAPLPTGR
ncbi:bifunctional 3-(3-hydroxy-phenyl)propionate/3-hydroxycinnamic acid hydroxylase [Streptomyces sp. enrichment culture]|uniref:bifunctional 3-(3-hydroxy-phenyl)propionate/3-hydroxycinnamic acid hydroxylase MhpA n=1 Tax=Streptomyces sp. enrichment culture TaxID=1795815 RepID=UPI003F54BED1